LLTHFFAFFLPFYLSHKTRTQDISHKTNLVINMSRQSRSSVTDKASSEGTGDVWQCVKCKKEFKDPSSRLLECERCAEHHCIKCMKIKDAEYDFLNERNDIHWYCDKCEPKVLRSIQIDKEIEKKLDIFWAKVDDRLSQVNKDIDSVKESTNAKIQAVMEEMKIIKTDIQGQSCELQSMKRELKNEVKADLAHRTQDISVIKQDMQNLETTIGSLKGEMKNEIHEVKTTSLADIMKEEMEKSLGNMVSEIQSVKTNLYETKEEVDEQRDKERRRNNIIIYNIPESSADRADERTKDDRSFCLRMFNNVLQAGVSDEDLTQAFRLGRRGEHASSPRPFLIQLASYTQKNVIMESLYKLKHAEMQFKSVVVTHDMTKTERDECKRMVTEAKDQEAQDQSGEYIYRVRGLPGKMKIIKIRIRQ